MRRVRYGVGMSLNGCIADANGHTDFLVSDPAYDPAPFFASIDAVLMGRRTYEIAVQQGLRAYPGLQNYVISQTLAPGEFPEVEILRDSATVADLRRASGKDIWLCGGGILLASLLAANLVDTIEVGVSPTLLGGPGTPMLGVQPGLPAAVTLTLTHHRALPSGMIVLEYDVHGQESRATA
jgi:dihydrofolate reductase